MYGETDTGGSSWAPCDTRPSRPGSTEAHPVGSYQARPEEAQLRSQAQASGHFSFGHAGALEQVMLATPLVVCPYLPRDGGTPRLLGREPRAQRARRRGAGAEREARRECVGVAEHRGGYAGEVGGHLGEGGGWGGDEGGSGGQLPSALH